MNSVSHDFVTVDMRGLKADLVTRARERGVSVSVLVREAVAAALNFSKREPIRLSSPEQSSEQKPGLLKLSLRMTADRAARLDSAAASAGLSRSAFLSGLIDGVTVLRDGGCQVHLAALIASNAELSSLSRNVRHLANLLRRSESGAAQAYRQMLDTLADDVNRHLVRAGSVIAQLQPVRCHAATSCRHSLRKENS